MYMFGPHLLSIDLIYFFEIMVIPGLNICLLLKLMQKYQKRGIFVLEACQCKKHKN